MITEKHRQRTDSAEAPDKGVGCDALVSVRAFFWWLFVYQKWPFKPAAKQSWALWYTIKDLVVALWKLCVTTPIAPIVSAALVILDKDCRQRIIEGHARNAVRRDEIEVRGTITFR